MVQIEDIPSNQENGHQELNYYAETFRKIRNKKFEFYVISRIIHRLNDSKIEFTTQQLVRTDEGRFLLDLYFPQLKIAVEVDEDYHTKQVADDEKREKLVVEYSLIDICRINASKHQSLEALNHKIDEVITKILNKKEELISKNQFIPFEFAKKYDVQTWLSKKTISVLDDARFRRHIDVAKLFGKNYQAHQQAIISLKDECCVWFPKLYPNKDWNNELSPDGKIIQMTRLEGGRYGEEDQKKTFKRWYVFAHHSDVFGDTYYSFKGLFELTEVKANFARWVRLSDTIKFDGKGLFE